MEAVDVKKMDDSELIQMLKSQDESAFNELYERYHKLVYYIAYQITKCEADAEEIKQEVFLKVLRYANDIKDYSRFKYWLVTITQNECKRLFRSNKDKAMDDAKLDQLYIQTEKRREFLPEENIHYQEDMEILQACMLKLSDEHREVISLKYFGQLSIDEIAKLLNIPTGTVKSRLANAKKILHADVKEYCRRNDIKLSFRMDQLSAVCAAWVLNEKNGGIHKASSLFDRFPSFFNTTAFLKIGISVSFAACALFGTVLVKDHFFGSESQTYERDAVFDAKDTYRILKQWAHCEKELSEKSDAEKAMMRPLYEQLRQHGNLYYVLLEQYWNYTF